MTAVVNWNGFAVQYLIDKGADLTATNDEGKTALDLSRQYKQKEIIPILEKATS